ncbi:MAG: hypothetical protein ACREVK_04615 [Gammaproteobacteria bacterium]
MQRLARGSKRSGSCAGNTTPVEVAEEENMFSDFDQADIRDAILRCLHALSTGLDVAHSAPTKQGGA